MENKLVSCEESSLDTKMEDECWFFLGEVGDRYEATNCLITVLFSSVESTVSVGHSQ